MVSNYRPGWAAVATKNGDFGSIFIFYFYYFTYSYINAYSVLLGASCRSLWRSLRRDQRTRGPALISAERSGLDPRNVLTGRRAEALTLKHTKHMKEGRKVGFGKSLTSAAMAVQNRRPPRTGQIRDCLLSLCFVYVVFGGFVFLVLFFGWIGCCEKEFPHGGQ